MRRALLWMAVCAGCSGGAAGRTPAKQRPAAPAIRVDIARLEAKRHQGVDGLWRLAYGTEPESRALAVRGLARVGNSAAIERLNRIIESTSRRVWIEAVRGLALAVADGKGPELALALSRASTPEEKTAALFSLGRLGTAAELAAVAAGLKDRSPKVREAAGIALGVYGRRNIGLSKPVRAAVVAMAGDLNRDARYGAAYALVREHEPAADDDAVAALVALSSDADDEIRALAIFGLAQRKVPDPITYLGHLEDSDWRVSVQAVRALTQSWATQADRQQLAAWLAKTWSAKAERKGGSIHRIVEALIGLRPFAKEPAIRDAAQSIYDAGGDAEVRCRAGAILAAADPKMTLGDCAERQPGSWPVHERAALELDVASTRTDAASKKQIADALAADDPRVRAAAVTAHAPGDRPWDSNILIHALGDPESPVVGAAIDLMTARVEAKQEFAADVWKAVSDRARVETDPELRLSLLGLLAKAKIPGAVELCRDALTDPNRTIRQSARECLETATGKDPGPGTPRAAPALPPADITQVVGKTITWTVKTSRGTIVIELLPDAAPWHVAVLVALSEKKFYDGLLWHRVVPDFVIQGGDPKGSGWGGPGFTIPAEPSDIPYERGTVGIADAGLDTGGCQWFAMHSRAPHLDGRYTVVGRVVRGQDVVDSIRVGDTIVSATAKVTD